MTAARTSSASIPGILRRGAVPLLIAVAAGLLAGLVLNHVLDSAIEERTEESALALLARVGPDVEKVLAARTDPRETIERLGRQLSLRATLIAADGRILGDSGVDRERVASLENHAGRPEVREARQHGTGVDRRYSSTLGDRLVYAATRLRDGEVLRLAFPERELFAWESPFRQQTLAVSILASVLVAALVMRQRSRHAADLALVREAVAPAGRGVRPANPGPVSEEAAAVFSALGDLADLVSEREASARRDAAVSRTVFEAAPVGLLVVDPRLTLLDANPEAVRLLGAGALHPGEHVLELIREKSVSDLLEGALTAGRATAELRLASESGRRTLTAEAVRIAPDAIPGQPAAIAILRETRSPDLS